MPRGPLDLLKNVLGMHAQVVTKPSLATSGQLTILGKSFFVAFCHGSELTSTAVDDKGMVQFDHKLLLFNI